MAGAAGLEPANTGSKGRCLTDLATPQKIVSADIDFTRIFSDCQEARKR